MRQLDIGRLQDRLDKNTNEIEKLNGRLAKLYEDYLDKFINNDEYKNFSCHFQNRIDKCNHDIILLKKEIKMISNDKEEKDWIKLFKNHKNIMEIDRVTAIQLIDKIMVYKKGKLEISFKYQYNFDSISHYSNYEESEGCLNG